MQKILRLPMKTLSGRTKALPLDGPAPSLRNPQHGSNQLAQAYAAVIEAVQLHGYGCM